MKTAKLKKDCKHHFIVKGVVGYSCKECIKCGYWEVL